MALPENPDEADQNQEAVSANGAAGRPRDGRHPVPTMDRFTGELPDGSNPDSIPCQAVLDSVAQTVTSVTGLEPLHVVSKNTARQQLGRMTLCPQRGLPEDVPKDNVNEHVNEVASSDRAKECWTNSTETPEDALNAPSLSFDSLNSSLPPPLTQTDTEVIRESEDVHSNAKGTSAQTQKFRYENKCDTSHFAESAQTPHHQHMTSGYVSKQTETEEASQTDIRQNNSACSKESRLNTISCLSKEKYKCLQMSKEGIKELKRMSGTHHKPLHKEYHSFVARLQSFQDLSTVNGVKKDVLALAGFFYSGQDTVTCYHCACSLRIWEETSDPKHLHWQLTPNCRSIRTFRGFHESASDCMMRLGV